MLLFFFDQHVIAIRSFDHVYVTNLYESLVFLRGKYSRQIILTPLRRFMYLYVHLKDVMTAHKRFMAIALDSNNKIFAYQFDTYFSLVFFFSRHHNQNNFVIHILCIAFNLFLLIFH